MAIKSRENFSGSLGVVLAAVGSAIGLGNIWKFPYIAGKYGGSAFIVTYLICILVIGMPMLLSEFVVGRSVQKDCVGAFKELAPKSPWYAVGWLSVLISIIIMTFYPVIAGWSVYYAYLSITGQLSGLAPEEVTGVFTGFISNPWEPIFWQVLFVIATGYILLKGVKNGIERFSRYLMPLLFIVVVILAIRSVTLAGATPGIDFLLKPDFSKLSLEAVLAALQHSFFTLSIGMAIMVTYGSYIKRDSSLGMLVLQISVADTLIALLAGLAIFPAVFAFGIEPSQGPSLVFITLPNVFNLMPMGSFFAFLFFSLLTLAAMTSAISIAEPGIAYLIDEFNWSRKKATIGILAVTTVIGAVILQGNGIWSEYKLPFYIGGKLVYKDIFDWVVTSTDLLLPITGFFIAIFVGWVLKKDFLFDELTSSGRFKASYAQAFHVLLKFIVPVIIAFIFLSTVFGWWN